MRSRSRAASALPSFRPLRARRGARSREVARADGHRREVREALVEARARDEVERDRARVGVRRAVGDEHERGASGSVDLDLLVEARVALPEHGRGDPHEGDVAGRRPSGLRPSSSTRRTSSASKPRPALKPKRRPFTRPSADPPRAALGDALRRVDRIARKPERAREDARPAAREEPERHVGLDAVQHLVVRPVAAEHVDRVDLSRRPRDLGRLPGRGREPRLRVRRKRALHRREPMLVDARGERVDDEQAAHRGVAYPRTPSTRIAMKRSASSSVSRPGSSQV